MLTSINRPDNATIGRWCVAAVLVLLGAWSLLNWPTPALFVAPGILCLVRRKIPLSVLSPVWVIILFLTAVTLLGYAINETNPQNVELIFRVDADVANRTVLITAASTTAMVLGACIPNLWRRTLEVPDVVSFGPDSRWTKVAAIVLVCIPLLLGSLIADELWSRPTYIDQTKSSSTIIGVLGMACLGGIVALGYLFRSSRLSLRVLVGFVFVVEVAILFSLGTRLFAMAPVALALGAYIYLPDRSATSILLGAGVLSVLLLPIPLHLRDLQTEHGLSHYLPALGTMPWTLDTMSEAIGNLSIGFPVTGIAAFESDKIGIDKILISVNPMFGRIAGWYEITEELRITPVFPYSAIGELWNTGTAVALFGFFVIGIVFGYMDRRIRELMLGGRHLVAMVLFGLVFLSGILMSSYNLRNSTRTLYYALAVDIAIRIPYRRLPGVSSGGKFFRVKNGVEDSER